MPVQPNHSIRALVFGASGYIGSYLVPLLTSSGFKVRACSRSAEVLQAREWPQVEVVAADSLVPASLHNALAGIEVAYYLVHSMSAGKHFARLDLQAAANFAAAAEQAGVKHIVYLGGLVPKGADSEHINSRKATGEMLRNSGSVPVTELRAGIIVGPGSAAFEVMRDLVFHLPVMLTPKWVRSKSPPIALDDLLQYLVLIALNEQAFNKVYDTAGSEYLNYEQMMRVLANVAGVRAPLIIAVPLLSPKLSSYWLKYVSSVPTNIACALIEGLRHDFKAQDAPLRELIPLPLLDFRTSVERVFAIERKNGLQSRWVEGAFSIRQQRIDVAYYAKKAGGCAFTPASPESLWRVLCTIGGNKRYFYLNFLWTLRELIDWAVGGVGRNRKRRHPSELRLGDKVDSWTVMGMEKEQRLTLQFGMRAPGAGVLEFEISQTDDGQSCIRATAYWHPAGVLGLLYWYALDPAHWTIFKGMTKAICKQAEALEEKSD